jgi:hypothetical protein
MPDDNQNISNPALAEIENTSDFCAHELAELMVKKPVAAKVFAAKLRESLGQKILLTEEQRRLADEYGEKVLALLKEDPSLADAIRDRFQHHLNSAIIEAHDMGAACKNIFEPLAATTLPPTSEKTPAPAATSPAASTPLEEDDVPF